ncbi:PREDICTED: polycystin-1-like, partial [Bison bison bison]|uniref:Polycystin-1-like n=1 Tax=Bison bison bison TaxID=43346 RepID=A0A6P3IQF3_BISBB
MELDISNNKISTLEEGIFANLFNLSEINLGGNPLECDCGLAWLPRWVEGQRVRVVRPEAATCAGPGPLAGQPLLGGALLDGACGEEYVACVPDDSSGAVALVAFLAAPEGPLAPEACSALCFAAGQALAALSEQGRCLCGAARPPNASSACLPSCSGPSLPPAPACRGPSLLQHVFPASPGATLLGPQGPLCRPQPRSLLGTLAIQACGGLCSAAVTRGGPQSLLSDGVEAGPLPHWVPASPGSLLLPWTYVGPVAGPESLDVWIGFSAVEGAAAGPAPQGGAFSLESCQNWLPGEPHPATAERCVRLGPAGQCNTDL